MLDSSDKETKDIRASKKGMRLPRTEEKMVSGGQRRIDIPISFTKGGGHKIPSTKEAVKRSSPCGKCGRDDDHFVLKHSHANICITAPDVSIGTICPCPGGCLNDKGKLANSIKVPIDRALVDVDSVDSEWSLYGVPEPPALPEPAMERRPAAELLPQWLDDEWSDYTDDDTDG